MAVSSYRIRFKRVKAIFLIAFSLIFLSRNFAAAQNCTSSLGDPIVNITFGNGVGYGPELPNGTTNLTYNNTSCPGDGSYNIVNESNSCYIDNWHSLPKDHTGDNNGRFMLINASVAPSDFYVQRVDGLCSGTTYQFSAWVLNMVTRLGGDPDITFSIENTDGSLIQSFDTQLIPKTAGTDWKQYAFTFSLPTGVSSVVLRMRNNAPGGLGNDLALDDITFRPMGPPITVSIQGVAGTSTTVCQDSGPLTALAKVGTCFPTTVYQWQVYRSDIISSTWTDIDGANGTTYNVPTASAGAYQYRILAADDGNIQSPNCRVSSALLSINVMRPALPVINIVPSKTAICASEKVIFTSFSAGVGTSPTTYTWQINGVAINNPSDQYITRDIRDGDVVTCQLTSNVACAVPALSNAVTMHVAGVAPDINIAASANGVCAGTPVTFTVTTNQTSGIGYQWQVNNASKPGNTAATFTSTDLKNGDVVTCMVSSSTCATPVSSDEIKMNIIGTAVSSVNIVASNTTVCPNTPVTFNADQIQGASYQWQINGKTVGTNNAIFVAQQVNDGDVINCLVLTSAVCTAPIPTNNITVHVLSPIKSVTLSSSPAAICKGTPVTFTATADQTTGVSYQWLVNGQSVAGSGNTLIKADLNNNDVVSCQASSTDNCSPPVSSNKLTMIVVDLPQISLLKSSYEIYKGESVTLSATASGTGLTYQWSPETGLNRTDVANPIANPAETTLYTLQVTNANGCTQTSSPITVKVLIKDIIVPNSFTPNNDGVNDKWEIAGLADSPDAQVQVFNRYGGKVYYSQGYSSPWDGNLRGKNLPAGVYYYTIRLSNKAKKLTGYVAIIR